MEYSPDLYDALMEESIFVKNRFSDNCYVQYEIVFNISGLTDEYDCEFLIYSAETGELTIVTDKSYEGIIKNETDDKLTVVAIVRGLTEREFSSWSIDFDYYVTDVLSQTQYDTLVNTEFLE